MSIPGSRRGVTLMEHMAVPENLLDYATWLRDPRTQRYLDLTEASLRPVAKPPDVNAERYGGLVDGRFEALRVLTHLDTIYEALLGVSGHNVVPETYGEEDILVSQWGVSPEALKKYRDRVKQNEGGE